MKGRVNAQATRSSGLPESSRWVRAPTPKGDSACTVRFCSNISPAEVGRAGQVGSWCPSCGSLKGRRLKPQGTQEGMTTGPEGKDLNARNWRSRIRKKCDGQGVRPAWPIVRAQKTRQSLAVLEVLGGTWEHMGPELGLSKSVCPTRSQSGQCEIG